MAKNEKVFTFSKVGNMVFLCSDWDIVYYAWDENEFTERKKLNAIARIKKQFVCNVVFMFNGV